MGRRIVTCDQARGLATGISVIIPSYQGRDRIGRCLRSLAQQTLDPALFEIIVVLNGEPDGSREVVEAFQAEHPSLTCRLVQLDGRGASRARNAGIAAASREYTTFVDDDDWVSPVFLEALLAHAGPQVVPIAAFMDMGPDGPDPENHINRMLMEHAGKLMAPTDIRVATTVNAGKAVSTALIKDIPYDVDLASGEDVVFWTTVVVRGGVMFYPCLPSDGATYYRTVRPGSVSRREFTFDFCVTQRLDVIARLERLKAEADEDGIRLIDGRISAQTDFIRDYLRQNPDEHGRVARELDRYPIFDLPYRKVTSPFPRGLAIAYAFPPYADTSAVVAAKRIRERGAVVDVIYNAMDRIRDTDDTIRRISGPFVADEAVLRTPSYFSDWGSMEQFSLEGLKVIERWETTKGRYRSVYSRAQFAASHFLAAAYKLSNPDAVWTAEFSDPLSRDIQDRERGTPIKRGPLLRMLRRGLRRAGLPIPRSRNCFVWCEELAYALADELIFTNENQMEYMLGYCANPELAEVARKKAVISPHPTLPPEFYSMVDSDYHLEAGRVHIAYFGNFYANRSLDDVLAAIAKCDPQTRERLRLHVFTSKPAGLRQRAMDLGVGKSVRVSPYVPYLEFLNLTTKFDCLLVNDAGTKGTHPCNPYLPSKWSDYRGSGTPVWGLVEVGSTLSRQALDFVSPIGDVERAQEALALLVAKKLAG